MKNNNKTLIIIGIVLLNIFVIYTIGQAFFGKEGSYDAKLAEARKYAELDLCSKSLTAYNEVIAIKDSVDIRLEIIDVYKKGMEIGEFTNKYTVVTAVTDAVESHRKEAAVYEAACGLFIEYGQYENCAELLTQARDLNVTSDKLKEYIEQIRYQFKKGYSMYTEVMPLFDKHYCVKTEDTYTYLDDDVSTGVKGKFNYASSFSEGYAFVQTIDSDGERRSFIIDEEGERQVYINEAETSSGIGKAKDKDGNAVLLLSCKVGNTYKYYNIEGKEVFGNYKFAGRFRHNVAAVQEQDGTWKLINGAGKAISKKKFNDIVLNEFDECCVQGYIIAREGDKYRLYDYKKVESIGDFSCDDAKAYVDGYIAFKSGDLWGFVDTKGKIVIDAKYENAKSFSNGLGAIYGGGEWKIINQDGDIVVNESFEDVDYLSDSGILFVKSQGYWSYLEFFYTEK